jgi:hypothetical protein
MARASRQRSLILNTNDLMMEYKHCLDAKKDLQLLNWITRHNFLLLDDIQFAQGNFGFQNFLCSVFNRLSSDSNAIVLCSNIEPEDNREYHITFYSRITSGITIELKMLDYNARVALLRQKFSHTGFGPDEEIISYLATEITQNVRTLKAAAQAVLACLLATPGKSEIDLPTVKKLLDSMHLYSVPGMARKEQAPEPSPPAPECPVVPEVPREESAVEPSPFIVVDIEDEKTQKTGKPPEEKHMKSGQYRDLVSSAETVDKQIDALMEAAAMRIEQLRAKDAGPGEIAKLEKAMEHLRNRDLEAAMTALK